MKCPNCNHENEENATFCSKCGAELVSESRKMSFFERRQAREREKIYLMSKASLQAEDLKNIKDYDMGEVVVKPMGDKQKIKKKTTLIFALSIMGIVLMVLFIYLVSKISMNDTLKVVIILALFIACATAGAYALDYGYRYRMIKAMIKSPFAIKKLSYGKPPVMLIGNTFYTLELSAKCDIEGCGADMHIEEYNGEFIAVCNADRMHLRKLNCALLNKQSQAEDIKKDAGDANEQNTAKDNSVELSQQQSTEDIISSQNTDKQNDIEVKE